MASQIEKAMRHEISVNRLASQIVAQKVNPVFVNVAVLVRRLLDDYTADMPSRELEALRNRTQKQLNKILNAMWDDATKELKAFAEYEAKYHAETLAGFAEASAAYASLEALAKKYDLPMVLNSGDTKTVGMWSEYVAGNVDATVSLVDAEIRAGRNDGLTNQQVVTRLVGLKKNDYQDGLLLKKSRKWAENLVKTGASHYANGAREAAAEANSDILEGKVFSNVFDNRTTPICLHYGQLAHQGKVYKLDDKTAPRLPLHFNERSLYIYKIEGVDPFEGSKSSVGGLKSDEAAQKFEAKQDGMDTKLRYTGKKTADIFKPGQIAANVSPQEFYSNQPDWFLESTFGPTRAKLFKDGGLPIEKFTDTMGRPLTLKEMKALDGYDRYFTKAGL